MDHPPSPHLLPGWWPDRRPVQTRLFRRWQWRENTQSGSLLPRFPRQDCLRYWRGSVSRPAKRGRGRGGQKSSLHEGVHKCSTLLQSFGKDKFIDTTLEDWAAFTAVQEILAFPIIGRLEVSSNDGQRGRFSKRSWEFRLRNLSLIMEGIINW